MNFTQAQEKLKSYGQEQVLKYFDELNDAEKEELLNQIAETDFSVTEMCTHKRKGSRKRRDYALKSNGAAGKSRQRRSLTGRSDWMPSGQEK